MTDPEAGIWFDWNRERHNEEVARKELAPHFLWRKLSYLTGYESGDLIYDQILKWKRISEAALAFNSLFKNAEKTLDQMGYRRRQRPKMSWMCPICGRHYVADRGYASRHVVKGWKDGQPCCDLCVKDWKPNYRTWDAKKSQRMLKKREHAKKSEQIASDQRRKLFAQWILSQKLSWSVCRPTKAGRPMAGLQEAMPRVMGGEGI